ncbi:ABC transporter substrate-binding protein [Nocardioides jishulii]|uniref:Extracellular solute-binding protein n=1 Tax=Nocardioides jishulii TaxID=2575440 RepID=A0A4U2YQR3_9ACTN|nr:extracellular solute-binding protein [Nocardioides jishulii]QCX26506.1 extracellular solute-binding protein [Nocardioides jishulii]TKI63688.1 extracellular solute-binding protein [Nocardioides jishulii]
MKNHRLKAGLSALALLAMTGLAACGGSEDAATLVDGPWEDVVAAAEDEGRVNLYSVAPPIQNDALVEAFKKAHPGIEVSVTRGAGELPGRVEQEIRSKSDGADVFIYTDPDLFGDLSDDLLEVDGPHVDGWADDFWAVEDKAIIPTKYPWTMFVWNTKTFPQGFKTWDDLLKPEVKGKLATRSDLTTSMAATYDFMEKELGEEFMSDLGDQRPKFYTSAVPMGQAVASGEAGVTMISTPSIVADLKAQKAPVEFGFPEPGFSIMWGAAALETSKRPNAARVFLDFVMSEEGQEAINGDGFGASGREDVKGALDLSEGWTFFDSAPYTPEVMNDSQAKFDKYFRD